MGGDGTATRGASAFVSKPPAREVAVSGKERLESVVSPTAPSTAVWPCLVCGARWGGAQAALVVGGVRGVVGAVAGVVVWRR